MTDRMTELHLGDVESILAGEFPGFVPVLLFACVTGSRSFNLHTPESDSDLFGVYVLDSHDIISSIPLHSKEKIIVSHDPDYTLYEVQTFCEMLAKGNPKVIEPLFQTRLCFQNENELWNILTKDRFRFINSRVVQQYISFAQSQLQDFSKGKGNGTKKYYHSLRLLREAKRIVEGQGPAIWITGQEKEYLMSVRRNEVECTLLDQEIENNILYLTNALDNASFIEEMDRGKEMSDLFLDAWLVKLRRITMPRNIISNDKESLDIKHPYLAMAQEVLRGKNVEGTILCSCVSGSYLHLEKETKNSAYGMVDYIAVYASSTDTILGMGGKLTTRISPSSPDTVRDTYTKGMVLLEINYVCSMIQQGNHRVMEVLFSDRADNYLSPDWVALIQHRNEFVTQAITNHYQGVGRGQLISAVPMTKKKGLLKKQLHHVQANSNEVIDTQENRTKLYHAARLLSIGAMIPQTKKIPTSLRSDISQFHFVNGIKDGTTSISEAVTKCNQLIQTIDKTKEKLNSVPRRIEERYSATLCQWLLQVRMTK